MIIEQRPITKAAQLNSMTFIDFFERIKMLAISMFEWKGLPEGIKPEFLERLLFEEGMASFLNHPDYGLIVLHATPGSQLNYQDEPTKIICSSPASINLTLENGSECVLIKNNALCSPTVRTVTLYAQRLAEIERTIDVNLKAQKTPTLILCTEKNRLTLKNVYNQYDGNQPVIFGDKNLDITGIQVLKTDAPYLGTDLTDLKHSIWNECMTFLGIGNANQDKKERLVSDEVSANDEQIMIGAETMLSSRKQAAKEINRIFGTEISVDLKCRKEEKNNGEIYDYGRQPSENEL